MAIKKKPLGKRKKVVRKSDTPRGEKALLESLRTLKRRVAKVERQYEELAEQMGDEPEEEEEDEEEEEEEEEEEDF